MMIFHGKNTRYLSYIHPDNSCLTQILKMRIVLRLMLLAAIVQTSVAGVMKENKSEDKDVKRSGYNPGNSNGGNGQSGYNPGNTGNSNGGNGQSGYNPGYTGGGGNNPGNGGASGYNPGQGGSGGVTGGSGFYPGNNGGGGYKPGGEEPSNNESNGWNPGNTGNSNGGNGQSGYNPGYNGGGSDNSGGAGYKPGFEEPSNGGSNGWTGGSGSGFNPGNSGGAGYRPGHEEPSNDQSSGWTGGSGSSGSSGYRPGNEEPSNGGSNGWTGGSGGAGYRPDEEESSNGESGYFPGENGNQTPHIPDFTPGAGQTGYNPSQFGYNPGSQRPSSPDENVIFPENGSSGFNPGATEGSGSYPRKSGGRKAPPRKKSQFRTPIIFADEENDKKVENKRPEGKQETSQTKKQTKPASENSLPIPLVYLLQPVGTNGVFNPQLLVRNPSTGISAQILPSPIQFVQAVPRHPYIPGQNKQQYLKPIQKTFSSNFLLRPVNLDKSFLAERRNILPPQALPSPVAGVSNAGHNPQLQVSNPNAGLSVQTLPSPIQFAQAVHNKQPYMSGQSKQQHLKGAQTSGQFLQKENKLAKFALLNPSRQTRPFTAAHQIPQVLQYSAESQTKFVESVPQTSRVTGDGFLSGVFTRPRYPPGYSQSPDTRSAPPPASGYAGPKTVLYIF